MNSKFTIEHQSVHLWQVYLPDLIPKINEFLNLLNPEEIQRANRFRFALHRERFIVARGLLRNILSLYTAILPKEIHFSYNSYGKPYLVDNVLDFKFNVSHSQDVAVYAITQSYEVGIDIEMIKNNYNDNVAQRFFSKEEYNKLATLAQKEKIQGFYRIWSGKEAIIKASGAGLFVPLNDFSLSLDTHSQWIALNYEGKTTHFYLQNFNLAEDYQGAFATNQTVQSVINWKWTMKGPLRLSN